MVEVLDVGLEVIGSRRWSPSILFGEQAFSADCARSPARRRNQKKIGIVHGDDACPDMDVICKPQIALYDGCAAQIGASMTSFKTSAQCVVAIWLALVSGCGADGGEQSEINAVIGGLPSWSEYAAPMFDPSFEGEEIVDETTPPKIEEITLPDSVVKVCRKERVSFYDTPNEYASFDPPTNIVYPGALVQGRSLIGDSTSLLPLNIVQRAPIRVSIPECNFADNFKETEATLAGVNSAVSDILFRAREQGVECAKPSGTMTVESFRNEQQRALKASISGRYLAFSAGASGAYSKEVTESSVAAIFRERLFTAQIQAPQAPRAWFSDDFTSELLQEQIDRGTLGPGNIPLYVGRVTYGRMLMATMTGNRTEEDMEAALKFKFENPAATVKGDAAVSSKTIREESRFEVAYVGGSTLGTASMLQSQDWTSYFSVPVTADQAKPISFELYSMVDDQLAVAQELTEYDRVTCVDKVAGSEIFRFLTRQEIEPGFTGDSAVSQEVKLGDVNGDGADDIIFAASAPLAARGQIRVALSNNDGTFGAVTSTHQPAAMGRAGNFHLLVADVDNDGRDDIIINILSQDAGESRLFVSFYQDDANGQFVHSRNQDVANFVRGYYQPWVAQMDGLRGADLVWNTVCNNPDRTVCNNESIGEANYTAIAVANDLQAVDVDLENDPLFGGFDEVRYPTNKFSEYNYTHVGDFDGDGFDDIMWQRLSRDGNEYRIAFSSPEGLIVGPGDRHEQNFGGSWGGYISLAGDANGDGHTDLIEPRQDAPFDRFGIYFGQGASQPGEAITPHLFEYYRDENRDVMIKSLLDGSKPDMFLADVDGNGSQDLIINKKELAENTVAVGLSIQGQSRFSFSPAAQSLDPNVDWSQFRVLVGNVADSSVQRDDILWVSTGAPNEVYVAVSRRE